jgi:hypothetical protein
VDKPIKSIVLEQLIRVRSDAGCSRGRSTPKSMCIVSGTLFLLSWSGCRIAEDQSRGTGPDALSSRHRHRNSAADPSGADAGGVCALVRVQRGRGDLAPSARCWRRASHGASHHGWVLASRRLCHVLHFEQTQTAGSAEWGQAGGLAGAEVAGALSSRSGARAMRSRPCCIDGPRRCSGLDRHHPFIHPRKCEFAVAGSGLACERPWKGRRPTTTIRSTSGPERGGARAGRRPRITQAGTPEEMRSRWDRVGVGGRGGGGPSEWMKTLRCRSVRPSTCRAHARRALASSQ